MHLLTEITILLLADSEYSHQLEADIEPFKALLLGLFFMAVGMSTNIGILEHSWALVLVCAALLITLKMAVVALIGKFNGLDNRRASMIQSTQDAATEFRRLLQSETQECKTDHAQEIGNPKSE